MKTFIKKFTILFSLLISSAQAISNSVQEAITYQESEIKNAIGHDVKIKLTGIETKDVQAERNLNFAINQIGSSIPYLAEDYFNKKWFQKN
jgi:hypothetical protein